MSGVPMKTTALPTMRAFPSCADLVGEVVRLRAGHTGSTSRTLASSATWLAVDGHVQRFLGPAGWLALVLLLAAPASRAAESPTQAIDFCQATGITAERLAELVDAALETGLPNLPLTMILRTAEGKCLVDTKVKVAWEGGSEMHAVRWTGQIVFALNRDRVKGLKLLVPPEYTRLTQTSFPEGTSYQPPADFSYFKVDVADDAKIRTSLQRQLIDLRRRGQGTPMPALLEQLQRQRCTLDLPAPSNQSLTPAEIYRHYKSAVVVMAGLSKAGNVRVACGVIIAAAGIVVTNYHVLVDDTPATDLIGAMLADGRVVPVLEVLAADRASDVAIVRIAAEQLSPAALSPGEPVGAEVTIISHPDQRFYFLTTGYICRYARSVHAGDERAYVEVSAEFMPGSSGGPALAANGAVAGIVSTITQTTKGMVFKQCIPVQSIRRLIETPPAAPEAKP